MTEPVVIERLSTVRLLSPLGVKVDLIFASRGIEADVVERAVMIDVPGTGPLPDGYRIVPFTPAPPAPP